MGEKMKENDWDDIADFDEIEDLPTPTKPEAKVTHTPRPAPATPRPPEPPPTAAKSALGDKDTKTLENVVKAAQKLSKELETLDFQLEKFTKFEQKVSSFKVKNTIAVGAVALLIGGYIGSLAQSELNNYYVNQELKNGKSKIELVERFEAAGFGFAGKKGDNFMQIYSKNPKVKMRTADGFQILELQNDKK